MNRAVLVLFSTAMLLAHADVATRAAETYRSVSTDAGGRLVIRTTDDRTIVIEKDGEQTAFGEPVLSDDRTAVAVQALFPNCCTSYDLPRQLVVYSAGRVHRFRGNDLPIFQWHFADRGSRIAFGQEPAHFGCTIHYELREIRSERLLESADIPQPCGQLTNPEPVKVPTWVSKLRDSPRKRPNVAGGTPEGQARATEDSWGKLLAFLDTRLRNRP